MIKHDGCKFFASDNFYPAFKGKLSEMKIGDFSRNLESENECKDNSLGLFATP